MVIKRKSIEPIEFDGLKIFDFTADKDNSSSMAEITVPKGVSHKLSWSTRSDKYYYVIAGTILFTIKEEIQILSAGDCCIVPKGDRFRYKNTGLTEARLLLVHTPSFKLECEEFADSGDIIDG
ncbi:cupin domain-containing protein [candidate division KSB1 bacterium]|nr:cupin domain-containing protein [candidate division KSB1 bacterium]